MKVLWHHVVEACPMGIVLCTLLLTGCASPVRTDSDRLKPAGWPSVEADPALRQFRIDAGASLLLVRVDPAGPMARLGHSHVIGSENLQGFIQLGQSLADTSARILIHLTDLEVDRAQWRQHWGLEAELDRDTIQDTRANLLGERVLHADEFPTLEARITEADGFPWLPAVSARIRMRGEVRQLTLPVAVFDYGDRIEAIGEFAFDHADFGLKPFSAAAGALRVAETIRVRFRIKAIRDQGPAP